MTNSAIPEPQLEAEYSPDEYATATSRVQKARQQLLDDPKASAAHQALTAQIEARLDEKEATLREVRRAIGLTQSQVAEMLGMSQGDVSKLERRENLHLATLSRFIEATGGRLRICAWYGDTEVTLKVGDLLGTGGEEDELLDA